jgi:hypothetical protein
MWSGEDNDVMNRTLRNDWLDIWKKGGNKNTTKKTGECWIDFVARIGLARWLCGYLAYEFLLPPGLAPAARGNA